MPFDAEAFLTQFEAGKEVHLPDTEFQPMEDALVQAYLPAPAQLGVARIEAYTHNWEHRQRLIDAMRGSDFFGRLIDPVVTKQAEPLAAFKTAPHSGGYRGARTILPENIIGLELTAGLKSTRRDIAGSITRLVWYIRKSNAAAAVNMQLWVRIVGPNTAENTISKAMEASRASARSNGAPRNGRVVGRHRRSGR